MLKYGTAVGLDYALFGAFYTSPALADMLLETPTWGGGYIAGRSGSWIADRFS